MRPDDYWSGVIDKDYGYLTSRTELKSIMKKKNHVEIATLQDREDMDKVADRAVEEREKKFQASIRKWTEKTFGPEGLGLGGADGEKLIKENL